MLSHLPGKVGEQLSPLLHGTPPTSHLPARCKGQISAGLCKGQKQHHRQPPRVWCPPHVPGRAASHCLGRRAGHNAPPSASAPRPTFQMETSPHGWESKGVLMKHPAGWTCHCPPRPTEVGRATQGPSDHLTVAIPCPLLELRKPKKPQQTPAVT